MEENMLINGEKKIALLIDAENTNAKYIDVILSEIRKYGNITYQRMYGDFHNNRLAEWDKKSKEYAIVPIYQQNYTSGKNAADIMLVIDAMDILYRQNVDIFCIVSSDSDFTRLVNRIKEDAIYVVGMGQSMASKTFVKACNEYKFLDKIIDEEEPDAKDDKITDMEEAVLKDDNVLDKDESEMKDDKEENSISEPEKNVITPIGEIKSAINSLVIEAENKGLRAHLGSTKSQLQRIFSDFDERNYGYSRFKKFIEDETNVEIETEGTSMYIVRKNNNNIERKVCNFIKEKAKEDISLRMLGNEIHTKFPKFSYKESGYSQFSKFVASVEGVEVYEKTKNKWYIRPKKK
ncbi:MAG: NYN domain-containing protein [Clostridium sp.]|nr:NYN domain-containing protein [Clostridium sp.]MCM1208110.1 NYN domain-containing protein [Ruminococcus sp.]